MLLCLDFYFNIPHFLECVLVYHCLSSSLMTLAIYLGLAFGPPQKVILTAKSRIWSYTDSDCISRKSLNHSSTIVSHSYDHHSLPTQHNPIRLGLVIDSASVSSERKCVHYF